MTPRDLLLALLVVLLWGVNFVVIKWGVDVMPPLLLTAMRYTLAALPAVFFIRPPKVRLWLLATYGVAFAFSAVSLFVPALGMVWFVPLGAAIWLDIKWFNLSRTRKGRAALAFAKEEANPPAPLPPPPYHDPWFRPAVMAVPVPATGPIPVNPPAGWFPHDGVQRWWDGTAWTEHVLPG